MQIYSSNSPVYNIKQPYALPIRPAISPCNTPKYALWMWGDSAGVDKKSNIYRPRVTRFAR